MGHMKITNPVEVQNPKRLFAVTVKPRASPLTMKEALKSINSWEKN